MGMPELRKTDMSNLSFSKGLRILILISSVIFLSSCVKAIHFKVKHQGGQLVVQGMITNSGGKQELHIGMTSPGERKTIPVDNAHVTIYENTDHQEDYHETDPGIYIMDGNIVKGIPANTYHLVIKLENGKEYQTIPETMPMATGNVSAHYKLGKVKELSNAGVELTEDAVFVYADTQIPKTAKPLYLKWDVDEVYKFTQVYIPSPFNIPPPVCYVTIYPNTQNIMLYNGAELNTDEITDQKIATQIINFSFYQKHNFDVYVSSITRNAYEYWKHVNEVVNSNGTIFDVPPATVQGNVYSISNPNENVLGYFEAAVIDTSRFAMYRYEMPIPILNPCATAAKPECNACLLLPNSTLQYPSNFDDIR